MEQTMPQGPFCQSCSMPLQKPEDFGTNADGSKSEEYCQYCYQNGAFKEPNITLEEMTEKVAKMMKDMNVPDAQIEQTKAFLPTLKRWQKA